MSVIDVEALIQPLSEDQPSGEDLEYDPAFGELERAATGTPERQMGDEIVPGEPPNWREVKKLGTELLSRSRDLRVATRLAHALVHTDGVPGIADGLALIRGLLDNLWDSVHPQLDPDDDNDPTMRVNTLLGLAASPGFAADASAAPLVESRALGRFSLRDVEIASGRTSAPADMENVPDTAQIDGAFLDADLESLQEVAEAAKIAAEQGSAVDTYLTQKLGAMAPDLSGLLVVLGQAHKAVAEQLSRRGVGDDIPGEGAEAAGGGAAPASPISGQVNSREDVIRVLDKAIDYFARNEPSSPVPLLLRRAKRLVSKDFLEILRDMAPDGVTQAETIAGAEREE